jgi:aryl sulfotransferase
VWLASYPKSGNTWARAILTALDHGDHLFGLNDLGSGQQPHALGTAPAVLGLDPRWLVAEELELVRTALVRTVDGGGTGDRWTTDRPPLLRKTHEVYRRRPANWSWDDDSAPEPFPADATRAAILVVRDPRDVVCSYAAFFGMSPTEAVAAMARAPHAPARPGQRIAEQPWGSWSEHVRSWLDPDVPFPVHLVRYEDLRRDAVGTLGPVLAAVGLAVDGADLARAVDRTRLDRLRQTEAAEGFRENSPRAESFFRSGTAGGWRGELSAELVAAVEADHGELMERLGYPLTTDPPARRELADRRAAERAESVPPWLTLPAELGIRVSRGPLPDRLPGAVRPRPWIWVGPRTTLVRFGAGGGGVLARDGALVQLDPGTTEGPGPGTACGADPGIDRPADDPSWMLQGWGVTLTMLQRGLLSLHAAVVDVAGRVVCIAGDRGAGKSTTAMGLRARGHRLLVDDVALVSVAPSDDGPPRAVVLPYARNVHLLPDAVEALGLDPAALSTLAGGRGKAAFRPEPPPSGPRVVDHVVVLSRDGSGPGPECRAVTGADRLVLLREHTDRDGIAPRVLGPRRYFEAVAALATAVPVTQLVRPDGGPCRDQVLDLVERVARGTH